MKNPDFLLKNPDFLLKNPDFITQQNICRTCPHDGCVTVEPKRYRIEEHGEALGELNMTKEIFAVRIFHRFAAVLRLFCD